MIDLSESTNRYYHSSIANETSFPSPFALSSKTFLLKSYHSLYRYDWTLYDLQYLFLSILGIFLFYLIEVSGIIKVSVILLLSIGLCYSTKTRSFLLPFLPVATWLMLFYSCRFIPETKRPHIYVSVLPTLENILYGDNISVIMARNTNTTKDIFAWIPYGILHFSLPFLTSFGIWIYGIKGILPVFSRAFGYMNIVGVLTQLVFPCSPPWYEHVYGIETPASYSMPGEPGGLKRIDQLFDVNIYEKAFSGSPMVFGAFPSLHSACAVLQMVFIAYTLQNRKRNYMIYFLGFSYVIWIWWACMYLTHHYMVDLVGGGIYAMITFWFSWKWLPQIITIESRIVVIDGGDDEDNVINIIVDENDIGNSKNINDNDEWRYEEIIFAINDDIDDDDNNNNNINDNTDDDNNDVFVLDNASKGNGRIGIGSDCRTG